MDRRRFVALGELALPLRAEVQPNAHVSTTDPLVFSMTKGKAVNPGRVHLEFWWLDDEVEGGAKTRLTVTQKSYFGGAGN